MPPFATTRLSLQISLGSGRITPRRTLRLRFRRSAPPLLPTPLKRSSLKLLSLLGPPLKRSALNGPRTCAQGSRVKRRMLGVNSSGDSSEAIACRPPSSVIRSTTPCSRRPRLLLRCSSVSGILSLTGTAAACPSGRLSKLCTTRAPMKTA